MIRALHRHFSSDELETYSMGSTPAEEAERLEEHLLVCNSCRLRLAETDPFVASISRAAREIRYPESRPRFNLNITILIRLVAAAAGLLLIVILAQLRYIPQPVVAVNLVATRANGSESIAPAGRSLRLHPDLTALPPGPSYRMEVVDRDGARVWGGELVPPQDAVTIDAHRAGTYYVRLYTAAGELLREYGLELR